MKPISRTKAKRSRLLVVVLVFSFVISLPLLACAFGRTKPSLAVTIVNNSNLEFRHAYLGTADGNSWGSDQLNGSVIGAGATYTLSNVSCGNSTVKVVVEDQNGCFLYQTVSCSESSTWTIGASPSPDCGG